MGPRLVSRGNRCIFLEEDGENASLASMGPRLVSRGNAICGWERGSPGQLQWGRGLLAAEIRWLMLVRCLLLSVQWGRGLLAAEIYSGSIEGGGVGFAPAAIRNASMGPRLVSRGNAH